jgi:hypothetical protein
MMRSAFYLTNTLSWIFIVPAWCNTSPQVDMSLHSGTLFWFRANQSYCVTFGCACAWHSSGSGQGLFRWRNFLSFPVTWLTSLLVTWLPVAPPRSTNQSLLFLLNVACLIFFIFYTVNVDLFHISGIWVQLKTHLWRWSEVETKINLFLSWYSRTIAELEINNNLSLTPITIGVFCTRAELPCRIFNAIFNSIKKFSTLFHPNIFCLLGIPSEKYSSALME